MKSKFIPTGLALAVAGVVATMAGSVSAAQIEEVVVTAQKRAESVQDIPIAISAMTGDMLEELKMTTSSDVAAAVPNLQSSMVFGETQPIFSIRGMSMSDYNTNQASPVAVYVDEAPISSNFMQGLSMYDLERVEVLRGPQGTLYGKNTTGGAINFITRSPSLDGETSGNVKVEAGDYGRQHVSGGAETTLIEDTLGARLAFTYTKTDGYHKNHFPGGEDLNSTDTNSVRLTLKYETEAFDANLKLATGKNDGQTAAVVSAPKRANGFDAMGDTLLNGYGAALPGGALTTAPGSPLNDAGITSVDLSSAAAVNGVGTMLGYPAGYQPRDPSWDRWEGSHNKANKYETEFDSLNLRLNWDLGDYSVTSVTSYLDGKGLNSANTDGAPYRILEIDWGSEVESFSQDFRLTSDFDGDFNFITGLYYDEDEVKVNNLFDFFLETQTLFGAALGGDGLNPTLLSQTLAAPNFNPAVDATNPVNLVNLTGFTTNQSYTQTRESLAAYFHSTYNISEELGLTVGVRYTNDKGAGKDINTYLGNYNGDKIQDLITNNPTVNPEAIYTSTYNPENLKWDENKFTGKIGLDYQLNDDVMLYTSFSRGYRASAFNGGAQFHSAELSVANPETVNSLEVGFKSQLLEGELQLNGALFNYSYKNQQFVNVIGVQQFIVNGDKSTIRGAELEATWLPTDRLRINAGLGLLDSEFDKLTLADTQNGGTIDLSGNELFNAPKVNFNIAIQYVLFENESGDLKLGLDSNFISRQWFSAYNDKIGYDGIKAEDSTRSNANLTWVSADDVWATSLWVKNIEENDEPNYGINLQGSFGYDYLAIGAPRTMGVDFNYKF